MFTKNVRTFDPPPTNSLGQSPKSYFLGAASLIVKWIFEIGYFTSWFVGYLAWVVLEVERSNCLWPFSVEQFCTEVFSSSCLIKEEDWWRVILYHSWLRSKLVIRDKNSKGEQSDEKFTIYGHLLLSLLYWKYPCQTYLIFVIFFHSHIFRPENFTLKSA